MFTLREEVDVVVGGQWGSEGKGKWTNWLAHKRDYHAVVRVGGPNAGHTVHTRAVGPVVLQQIPVGFDTGSFLIIGPGAVVDYRQLLVEVLSLKTLGYELAGRLFLDPRAAAIRPQDGNAENAVGLGARIGSTKHGIGVATARKVMREEHATVADTWDYGDMGLTVDQWKVLDREVTLSSFLSIRQRLGYNAWMRTGSTARYLLEGTQGTLLSLDFGSYPFCTSRNAYATALLADCGFPPDVCRDRFMVMRTYPIRVAGNSGDFMGAHELTWDEVSRRAGLTVTEQTTVTKKTRRVAEFAPKALELALLLNRPTGVFLSFADYLGSGCQEAPRFNDLGPDARTRRVLDFYSASFMPTMESVGIRAPLVAYSTGPLRSDTMEIAADDWLRRDVTR